MQNGGSYYSFLIIHSSFFCARRSRDGRDLVKLNGRSFCFARGLSAFHRRGHRDLGGYGLLSNFFIGQSGGDHVAQADVQNPEENGHANADGDDQGRVADGFLTGRPGDFGELVFSRNKVVGDFGDN